MCRNPDNQFRFKAEAEQCHAIYAIRSAQGGASKEAADQSLSWSAYLRH